MKTNPIHSIIALTTAAFLCLSAGTALSFPFTDTFSYPLTNLAGNFNSETNAWGPCGTNNSTGSTDVQVTNFTLTYPGLSSPGTNSVLFGNLGYTERIAIAPPVVSTNTNTMAVTTNAFSTNTGTLYYSFIFIVTNLDGDTTNGGFVCGFNNTVGPQATEPTIVGGRLYIRNSSLGIGGPDGIFGYEIGVGRNPASPTNATWATNQFVAGGGANPPSTNFIVVSYTFGTNSLLWLNPDPSTFGAASPPTTGTVLTNNNTNDISAAESFMFRQGNTAVPIMLAADLRVGLTWAAVTPTINTNVAPTAVPLAAALSGTNVLLSWTTNNTTGFRLQGAPNVINSNAWTNVTASTNVVGTNYTVTDPVTGKNYYRLIYP